MPGDFFSSFSKRFRKSSRVGNLYLTVSEGGNTTTVQHACCILAIACATERGLG